MSLLDYAVITIYMVAIALIGLAASARPKTSADYFIANRSMPAWAVAMTLMATIIGSGTIVGLPGSTYQKGMILLLGNLTLPLVLILVAKYIVPFYRNVVGMSAYEFLGKRFGLGGKFYASFGFLADRTFDLGVTLVTAAIAVHVMTGWDLSNVIIGIALFTVAYTMVGGMEAVVWTSVAQGAIFMGAAVFITLRLIFATEVGAPGAVITAAWEGGRFSLGDFSLSWETLTDPAITTQWLFILAYTINWGRRYAADQHMVQRYLIAKTDKEASQGALWNALLCVPVWTVFMFIGACLYGYYQLSSGPGPANADDVMPHFILHHMPSGVIGLILAAILAASMSSISADMNSIATVATNDYLLYFKPNLSDKARLLSGRLFVALAGAFAAGTAILLIPEQGMASIMERAVTIAAILSGGTLGFFLLGFLTRRATRQGCYTGIAACLLFTAWGVLTSGGDARILDLGLNYRWHPMYLGIGGHLILFSVGYASSLIFGGYRPENVDQLTFRRT